MRDTEASGDAGAVWEDAWELAGSPQQSKVTWTPLTGEAPAQRYDRVLVRRKPAAVDGEEVAHDVERHVAAVGSAPWDCCVAQVEGDLQPHVG